MHGYNVGEILHRLHPHPSPGAYLSSCWLLRSSHIFPLCACPSPPASWLFLGSFIFIFSVVHPSIQQALRKHLGVERAHRHKPRAGPLHGKKGTWLLQVSPQAPASNSHPAALHLRLSPLLFPSPTLGQESIQMHSLRWRHSSSQLPASRRA